MGYAISFSEYCSEYPSKSYSKTTMYKNKKLAQKNFDEIKQKLMDCPNKDISEIRFTDDKTIKYKRQLEFLNFVETRKENDDKLITEECVTSKTLTSADVTIKLKEVTI